MVDRVSPAERSANMRAIKSKGMRPELAVRRLAHSLGYRFRLHRKDLPGNPDLVFAARKKAIFVHGCFWHQHPDPSCKAAHRPKSNLAYWQPKLLRNTKRDTAAQEELSANGWEILTVWECETKDLVSLRDKLLMFLGDRR